jgi:hypothetical protein
MKLFGELILGGRISFTSSESDGTIFKFSLPRDQLREKGSTPDVGSSKVISLNGQAFPNSSRALL